MIKSVKATKIDITPTISSRIFECEMFCSFKKYKLLNTLRESYSLYIRSWQENNCFQYAFASNNNMPHFLFVYINKYPLLLCSMLRIYTYFSIHIPMINITLHLSLHSHSTQPAINACDVTHLYITHNSTTITIVNHSSAGNNLGNKDIHLHLTLCQDIDVGMVHPLMIGNGYLM